MSNDLWRWADPDGQQRRVRLDELRAALAEGHIAPNTPVWRAGWQNWQPAHEVPELSSASVGGANGVVLNIPPPPLAMVAVQQEYEAASGSIAPGPPAATETEQEPPPPPAYVPMQSKAPSLHPSSGQLKTQMGGSAHVPAAPGSAPVAAGSSPTAAGSAPRLGPSLPTQLGIAPPPGIVAAAPRPRSAPPPPPPAAGSIEELSASMLIESPSTRDLNGGGDGFPPPTDPIVHDGGPALSGASPDLAEDAVAGLPRRPGLSLILDDIAEIRQGRPPKNKLLIGVLGVVALSVLITFVAGIVSIASGPSSSDAKKAASSASASAVAKNAPPPTTTAAETAAKTAPVPIPPPPPPAESGSTLGDCTSAGDAKTIAPRAVIASAIEAHALGGNVAFGFAASARDAWAISLDPSSLVATATVRTKPTGGDARRVTPMLAGSKLIAMPDVDRKGDRLGSRRVVAASPLVDVGVAEGGIVWAPHGKDSYARLFTPDGDGPIEALRAIALTDRKGIAVTFRRGNAIHVGAARGESVLEAEGELSRIGGLGQVGSPAIAASGDSVIAAWADRTGAGADWTIRWTKIKIGSATEEATPFALPEGGLGEHAMSPSLAALGGGRFLLAWTEGPVSNHQVRAITIGADGSPSGAPIAISAPGDNAGQPAAVVGPDGRGAIAFLSARGKALEVHAAPITCPPR
ncbi:MAG: DUF4339 domain-containing protein [Labilithrix sp.]|nr:DUF4339 domain-containing protein [Labilithrix sp.]